MNYDKWLDNQQRVYDEQAYVNSLEERIYELENENSWLRKENEKLHAELDFLENISN